MAESTLLTLDHIGERLERTLIGTSDSPAASTVIQQRVNGLLQHALLVTHNDIGRVQIQQALESIVTVNHPAIQIVEIRGCEAAAIERYQRAQIRR